MTHFLREEWESPTGRIDLYTFNSEVVALDFAGYEDRRDKLLQRYWGTHSVRPASQTSDALKHLQDYFQGDWSALSHIPVQLRGTPFQMKVWQALRTIPTGETRSYGDIARQIQHPTAFRAVGLANGANPVAIIIPCHRVIGSNQQLTGYGGGLDRKQWLLRHEKMKTLVGT